jgi:hypothetical protein
MDSSSLNINSNHVYQDYTKATSETSSTNRNSEFNSSRFENEFGKSKSADQKSTIVTEQLNKNTSAAASNLRLQPDAPVVQMNISTKAFNETQKDPTVKVESDEYGEFVGMADEAETGAAASASLGKGNYIVVDSFTSRSSIKKTKSPVERLRDKLTRAYNSDLWKAPGTLVNMVF